MIGRQRAAPCKCIGSNSLSRAEGDAGRGLSTPIVHRVTELDGPTRAIGRNTNGGRIGNNCRCTTRQPLNGCGTHRHSDVRDVKRRGRRTLARWLNQWRNQLVGTGHLNTTQPWIRMICRQRTAPCKCVRFGGLSLTKVDTGRGLTTPIVDRVIELDCATWTVGCNVNCCRIGHGQVRTASDARD